VRVNDFFWGVSGYLAYFSSEARDGLPAGGRPSIRRDFSLTCLTRAPQLWHHVDTMFLQEAITAMKAVVKKWGNSASVRIPSAVLQAAKLRLEDSVDVREESGRIVIEPLPRNEYELSELLKKITPENLHDEVDFGRPVGKEAW